MFSRLLWSLLACAAVGCATPPQVVEQSAAATELYAQIDDTFVTWRAALRSEFARRERAVQLIQLRTGEADFDMAPGAQGELDLWLASALGSFRAEIEWLRISHGIVDRFLRIDVIDLDEVQSVSERARELFEASSGGGS
jgi:hypothetical protein